MKTTTFSIIIVACGSLFVATEIRAADQNWPQWRGPAQNGVSAAANLPAEWNGEAGTNIIWKTALPAWSGATPIVWEDRVFIMSPSAAPPQAEENQEEAQDDQGRGRGNFRGRGRGGGRNPGGNDILLLCISRAEGSIIWEQKIDDGNALHMKGNHASPSPVTDGANIWVVTGNGGVASLDFEGNFIWRKNLEEMYGDFGLNWGYASSPLLYEDKLIVEVLHGHRTDDPSYIVAFNKATGDVIWKVERPTDAPAESPDAYTTPVVLDVDGEKQIVITGGDYITGHDPATGAELWRVAGLNPRRAPNYRIVASPIAMDGMIYAPTRVRPLLALRANGADTESDNPEVAWTWDEQGSPDVPTPICDGTHFYMVDDKGLATCIDAKSGETIWGPERTVSGTVSGSPVLADGKIYFTTEDAFTVVLAAGPEFRIIATNELDGSYTLSSPTCVGEQIFIRTGEYLYCIGKKK